MHRWFAVSFLCVILGSRSFGSDADAAKWIWHDQTNAKPIDVSFAKSFAVTKPVTRATLRLAVMYTGCTVRLDENTIAEIEPYDAMAVLDVTERFSVGNHRLNVQCKQVEGPSSFFCVLELTDVDGSTRSVVSNESWKSDGNVVALDAVSRKLLIPRSRRADISAVENYEQWKQALGHPDVTDPATFQVTEGFEIRLVRAAKEGEDSWVSFAFDPQGRIIVAKEQVGLLRMTLAEDGSTVLQTETIDETLKECRGLVWRENELFANANDSKALFRIKAGRNGKLAHPVELMKTPGGAGHGRNDLCFGPDGMLYSIHGDSVDLPDVSIDHTSPNREARRGSKTSEGHLVRIDPETGDSQLITAGLRNPFGIDFNHDGEAFTYDADAEYDMGAPWYRPTRVNHLVAGGDYGWRGVTKSWPPYYCDRADNAPPNLDIGKGSPTAVKFGTRSNFPQRYREALFVLDWAYGRVLAVNMIPRGASYLMAAETFLQGRPLNVTDIEFAPDGSMYLITGGRKTRSAIYRVHFVGDSQDEEVVTTPHQRECHEFAAESRARRRRMETQLLETPDQERLPEILGALENSDPWIQYAAMNLLERYPVKWWADSALKGANTRMLLALARLAKRGDGKRIVRKLSTFSFDELPISQRLELLRAYQLVLSSDESLSDQVSQRLLSIYPADDYASNRLLIELLSGMNVPSATPATMELLRSSSAPVEQLQYLYALRNVTEGWTLGDRRTYFNSLQQAEYFVGGAGMPEFLAKIREEAVATLRPSERERLADVLQPKANDQIADPPPRDFVRQWTVNDLMAEIDGDRNPDLSRGKVMFAAASCNRCHRIGGEGTLIGPDLTAASGRYTRRDLLTAIIDPSQVIAENYRSMQVITSDGKVFTGQVAVGGDYRSPKLRLAVDAANPFSVTEIDKSEILSKKYSPVSWMPADLLNTLTADEVQDLISYIESGGR